jgi:hypothetical protein
MVGLKIAEPTTLPGSRLSGMKTQHSTPSRAACAATLLARFPVDEHGEPELHRPCRSDRDNAVLVRQRRVVDRFILDVQLADAQPLGQARAADERREAGVEPGPRLAGDREQLPVAPQIVRPRLDLGARDVDRRVVVEGLERAEAAVADIERFGGKLGPAEMTA